MKARAPIAPGAESSYQDITVACEQFRRFARTITLLGDTIVVNKATAGLIQGSHEPLVIME